jgi:class 3 adenylate cyclase
MVAGWREGDHSICRGGKEIHVKGRAQPVMTYEVLGIKGETSPEK